jgi:hypothetical protein
MGHYMWSLFTCKELSLCWHVVRWAAKFEKQCFMLCIPWKGLAYNERASSFVVHGTSLSKARQYTAKVHPQVSGMGPWSVIATAQQPGGRFICLPPRACRWCTVRPKMAIWLRQSSAYREHLEAHEALHTAALQDDCRRHRARQSH